MSSVSTTVQTSAKHVCQHYLAGLNLVAINCQSLMSGLYGSWVNTIPTCPLTVVTHLVGLVVEWGPPCWSRTSGQYYPTGLFCLWFWLHMPIQYESLWEHYARSAVGAFFHNSSMIFISQTTNSYLHADDYVTRITAINSLDRSDDNCLPNLSVEQYVWSFPVFTISLCYLRFHLLTELIRCAPTFHQPEPAIGYVLSNGRFTCLSHGHSATFRRFADLKRHILSIDQQTTAFYCRFPGCKRYLQVEGATGKPFSRKDKRDEHERKTHNMTIESWWRWLVWDINILNGME